MPAPTFITLLQGTDSNNKVAGGGPAYQGGYLQLPGSDQMWIGQRISGLYYYTLINVTTGATIVSVATVSISATNPEVASYYGFYRPLGIDAAGNALVSVNKQYTTYGRIWRATTAGALEYVETTVGPHYREGLLGFTIDPDGVMWEGDILGDIGKVTALDWTAHTCTVGPILTTTYSRMQNFIPGGNIVPGRVYVNLQTSGSVNAGLGYISTAASTTTLLIPSILSGSYISPRAIMGSDTNIYAMLPYTGASAVLTKYDKDGNLLATLAMPVGAAETTQPYLYDGRGFLWCRGSASSGSYTDWKKINVTSMTVVDSIAFNEFDSMSGEYPSGSPILFGDTAAAGEFGKIGIMSYPPVYDRRQSFVNLK